jgi:hypothetical protein
MHGGILTLEPMTAGNAERPIAVVAPPAFCAMDSGSSLSERRVVRCRSSNQYYFRLWSLDNPLFNLPARYFSPGIKSDLFHDLYLAVFARRAELPLPKS